MDVMIAASLLSEDVLKAFLDNLLLVLAGLAGTIATIRLSLSTIKVAISEVGKLLAINKKKSDEKLEHVLSLKEDIKNYIIERGQEELKRIELENRIDSYTFKLDFIDNPDKVQYIKDKIADAKLQLDTVVANISKLSDSILKIRQSL